jgi:ubiquinone/menaquinone biosynthesis C-methylase UbiE
MEARLQLRIQRYGWDRAASRYDECWRDALAPATDALLNSAALQRGERVLDVACGTGVLSLAAAAQVGSDGHVLGTDLSEKMVEAAAAAARALNYSHCSFARAEASTPPPGAGSFDAVLCGLGLMYVPDAEIALSSMANALRPGGRLVATVWGQRSKCGWAEVFPIVDARVESEVCPLFFRLGTGDAFATALRNAGMTDISTQRIPATLRYDSEAAACDAALVGGPVALAYARFDAPTRDAVRLEYAASIAPYRRGTGFEIPGEFVVVRGMRPN